MSSNATQQAGGLTLAPAPKAGGGGDASAEPKRLFWLLQLAKVYLNGQLNDLPFARGAMRLDRRVVLAALTLNLLGLALPLSVLQVYDRITANAAVSTLAVLCIGLVCVAAIEFALRTALSYQLALDANRVGAQLHARAVANVLSESGGQGSAADLQERFQALETLTDYYAGEPRRSLIDLPFSLVFLAAIAMIGGVLAFVPLVVFSIFIIVSSSLLKRSHGITDEREEHARRRADFLSEIFSGLLTVKGIGAEPQMLRRFERLAKGSAQLFRDATKVSSDIQLASAIFSNINIVAMVSIGAVLVISGDLTVGGLAACSLLSGRAVQPLIKAASALAELQRAMIAAETAKPLLMGEGAARRAAAPPSAEPAQLEARSLTVIRGEKTLLDEASFTPPTGGITVLTGRLGSGRSTVLRVLAGLEKPEGGEVLVDGASLCSRSRGIGHSAYVSAAVQPLHGTIMENLTLFGAGADSRDALWAMHALGADGFVAGLPAGYDTVVGSGVSEALSKALTRQLVLARAIAQRPRLLLLDEPHVYLDSACEQRLVETLGDLRGESTMIVVSDEPRMLEAADQIFEIAEGWAVPRTRDEILQRQADAS